MQAGVANVVTLVLRLLVLRKDLVVLVSRSRVRIPGRLVHVRLLDNLPWHHFPPLIRRYRPLFLIWLWQGWALLPPREFVRVLFQLKLVLAARPLPIACIRPRIRRGVKLVLLGPPPLSLLLFLYLLCQSRDLRVVVVLHLLQIP